MKKRLVKALKWLLVGVVCAVLAVIFYILGAEYGLRTRRLTYGCVIIAVLSIVGCVTQFIDKELGTVSTLVVEDIFKMNSRGCVVVGTVQGSMVVGEKITIQDQTGNTIKTTINGMEIYRQQAKVATNTPVALFLKKVEPDRIHKGDIVSQEH